MQARLTLADVFDTTRPTECDSCNGIMVFRGLGAYACEDCGGFAYDDYGKTRNFIEEHPGANVSQIAEATGVSRKSINRMVKEQRFEIRVDSRSFLTCELCGISIRSGHVCKNCEVNYHKAYEEGARQVHIKGGYGREHRSAEGSKRFTREIF